MVTGLNYVDHYTVIFLENFPFKKIFLALDMVIPRVGDNDA